MKLKFLEHVVHALSAGFFLIIFIACSGAEFELFSMNIHFMQIVCTSISIADYRLLYNNYCINSY